MEAAPVNQDGMEAGVAGALHVGAGLVADVNRLVRRHGHAFQPGFKDGGGGLFAYFPASDAKLQVFVNAQLSREFVHVSSEVGQHGQTIASGLEFGKNGTGFLELDQFFGHGDCHVPNLLGHTERNGDAGLFKNDLLVACEESVPVVRIPLAQGKAMVFLVEVQVGDGIAPGQAFRRYTDAQVLTGGVLDLRQRRPEPDQRVVEIEENGVNHVTRGIV